jgi:hypothetical protein
VRIPSFFSESKQHEFKEEGLNLPGNGNVRLECECSPRIDLTGIR